MNPLYHWLNKVFAVWLPTLKPRGLRHLKAGLEAQRGIAELQTDGNYPIFPPQYVAIINEQGRRLQNGGYVVNPDNSITLPDGRTLPPIPLITPTILSDRGYSPIAIERIMKAKNQTFPSSKTLERMANQTARDHPNFSPTGQQIVSLKKGDNGARFHSEMAANLAAKSQRGLVGTHRQGFGSQRRKHP